MRKRNPAPRAVGNGAEMVQLLGRLYEKNDTAPAPAVHTALCRSCGIEWDRPADRPWATLCPTCWKWSRVRRHVRAARKLVGVRDD